MSIRRILPLLLSLALAACGHAAPPPPRDAVTVAPQVTLRLPPAAALGQSVEAAQLVSASHGDDSFAFEGRLSVAPAGLILVTTDGLGRRAMTVRWSGGRLDTETAAWLPADVPPAANMLADIMLLYWPADVLRAALDGAVLEDDGTVRRLVRDGRTLVKITRGADPWNGGAELDNLAWGYRIQVASQRVAP